MASSSSWGLSSISAYGSTRCGSVDIFMYIHDPGGFGVEHFQLSLDVSGEWHIFLSCIISPNSVHTSDRTCNRLIQTSNSHHTMLDGGYLAFHCSLHVGRHFLLVCHGKRSHQGCLPIGRLGAKRSAITAFYPLATQRCVLHRQEFYSSICQTVAGLTEVFITKFYQQGWKE